MSEKREHHRNSEEGEFEHHRENDLIPNWLNWSFVAINRVGFPIVAFFLMCYYANVSQHKLSEALDRQASSLEALIITVNGNHAESKEWKNHISEQIQDIRIRLGK